MGTSTQVDALGETLTMPGVAAPPAAQPESDVNAALGQPVSSESATEQPSGACLSDDLILQYRQGDLTAAQLESIDQHLDRCIRCRELVELVIAEDDPDSSRHVMMFQRGFVVAQRYQIEQFVGKGGMGEVYSATDQMTGRRVALKTVLCTATDDVRAVRKLLDEVVNAQRVAHPHVFKIYDLHEHRDELRGRIPFFTMELIDGESLRARVKRDGVLPVAEARTLARQLLAGLAAAHAKGVLHLDFKVDNVMLRSHGGEAVIMDFGLSRASDMQSRQRTSERLQGAGTLPYMSLEQLECRPDLGPASDVYSFGVVLYEVLTGRLPFQAPSFRAILLAQLRERPAPPSAYAPVSPALDAFVLKCLARTPQDRFADAAQALAALELVPRWERPAAEPRRRHVRWLGLAALLGTVLLGTVLLGTVLLGTGLRSLVLRGIEGDGGGLRAGRERVLQQREAAVLAAPPSSRAAALALPAAPVAPRVAVPAARPTPRAAQSGAAGAERGASIESPAARGARGAGEPRAEEPRAEQPRAGEQRRAAKARRGRTAEGAGAAAAAARAATASSEAAAAEPAEPPTAGASGLPAGARRPLQPPSSDWSGPPPQRVPRPRPL